MPKIQPNSPNCQKLSRRTSSIVRTSAIGRFGSDARICARTAVVIDAGSPAATRIVRPVLSVCWKLYGTYAAGLRLRSSQD